MQHEGVHVAAELRDDERDALGHQARNEVNIAAQAVELRHGDMGAELLGSTTGGALQRFSRRQADPGSFEDAPVGDLADQGAHA